MGGGSTLLPLPSPLTPPPTRLSPPLSPALAHQAHLSNPSHFPPLPWWLSPSSPTWPADIGASEDTALRQIGGVVGADGGTATIALVVGHSARPGGGGGESVGKALAALVAQKGARKGERGDGARNSATAATATAPFAPSPSPLTARKDWDVIILSPLEVLPPDIHPPTTSGSSTPARPYYVYRPPGFVGVLEVHFERPTPPVPPDMGENVHPSPEDLLARWGGSNRSEGESHFATWQPCTLCPTPISTAGPYPAYFIRPSYALLSNLNAIRKLSTVNAHTLPHPSSSKSGGDDFSTSFYKDSVEPYGVLPWLCVWPGMRVLIAERPMVSSDGGMMARRGGGEGGEWGGEEEEVEMEVGSGEDALEGEAEVGRSTGWDLSPGGGLAAQLGALLDALPPPTLPGAVRALKCTQSLSPKLCVPEPNYRVTTPAHSQRRA